MAPERKDPVEEFKEEEESSEELGGDSSEEEGGEYHREEQDKDAVAKEKTLGELPSKSTR